jgi:hypothetical protein
VNNNNNSISYASRQPDFSLANDCRLASENGKRSQSPLDGSWTHEASEANEWPNRMVGKILFKRPNGDYASCSGSVLQKRLVVTAGHCAYKNGQYMSEYAFIPSFEYAAFFFRVSFLFSFLFSLSFFCFLFLLLIF